MGTSDSSLQKTILTTATVANLSIQTVLRDQRKELEQINAPGILGSFWKTRSLHQMQTSLGNAVRYRSLINTIKWAEESSNSEAFSSEEKYLEEAMRKIRVAEKVENQWNKFAANIPITLLYRELQSSYPSTQEELEKYRDHLQQTTCGEYPRETKWFGERAEYGDTTKCPEELLYAPLVAIAKQLAKNQILPKEELTNIFHELTEQSILPNKQLLIDLAIFLQDPTTTPVPSQLPSSVAKAVMNASWVERCGLEVTKDGRNILGCRRDWIKIHTVNHYPRFVYDPFTHQSKIENSTVSRDYMQKRHIRKFYCYEKRIDGTEAISIREVVENVSR